MFCTDWITYQFSLLHADMKFLHIGWLELYIRDKLHYQSKIVEYLLVSADLGLGALPVLILKGAGAFTMDIACRIGEQKDSVPFF